MSLNRLDRWSKEETRAAIIFLNAMGVDPVEIHRLLSEVSGQHTLDPVKIDIQISEVCGQHTPDPVEIESPISEVCGQHTSPREGFPYATPTLQSVAGSYTHDMNKQVQAAPAGLYSSSPSGPMTGAGPQHHQPGLGGPVPNPQSSSMVPSQGQQLNARPHMAQMPIVNCGVKTRSGKTYSVETTGAKLKSCRCRTCGCQDRKCSCKKHNDFCNEGCILCKANCKNRSNTIP